MVVLILNQVEWITGSYRSFVTLGFGRVSASTLSNFGNLIDKDRSTISQFYRIVIIVNAWQFVVSLIYIQFNAVLTAMLANLEWQRYATRKPLRVTTPVSMQRQSYFVSIPYRYGIPQLTMFAFLHYTISQSIFVVPFENFVDGITPRELMSDKLRPFAGVSVWAIFTCECQ
jgi:hypothetical protein